MITKLEEPKEDNVEDRHRYGCDQFSDSKVSIDVRVAKFPGIDDARDEVKGVPKYQYESHDAKENVGKPLMALHENENGYGEPYGEVEDLKGRFKNLLHGLFISYPRESDIKQCSKGRFSMHVPVIS